MHLIDAAGHVDNQFVHEDPATNRPPTEIDAAWLNAVQNELANAIRGFEVDLEKGSQDQLFQAISKAVAGAGGLPRFTAYIWGGRGQAMPEGDTQSSGQQLLDLMYPSLRQDVVATQFYCSEAEWQADPYKRVTHWSLGDGASWMRPPDKNCVQPGSVEGGFYGSGVGSSSPLLGTAVLDQMQSFKGKLSFRPSGTDNASLSGGNFYTVSLGAGYETDVAIVEADGNGAPRLGKFTRPRTWYGIWMIRMYGRVLNPGALNAAALNARLDLIDARVATLEGRHKALGDGQTRTSTTYVAGTAYTNLRGRSISVEATANVTTANGALQLQLLRSGSWVLADIGQYATVGANVTAGGVILPGEEFRFVTTGVTIAAGLEIS